MAPAAMRPDRSVVGVLPGFAAWCDVGVVE